MKQLYCFGLLIVMSFPSFAQAPSSTADYNLAKKRLLIQLCSSFLYATYQGKIDEDSATVLAVKIYKLPLLLSNDEGFYDASDKTFLDGSTLLEKGNITAFNKILAKTKGTTKIKLLLQYGNFYLSKPGAKPENLQNALYNIKEALKISNELKIQKWQHQSMMLLGKYYAKAHNLDESKNCFIKVVNECRKQNDQKALADALANQAQFLPVFDPQKEIILNEVIKLYNTLGLQEKMIVNYLKIVVIHYYSGNLKLALKGFYQSLYYQRKAGFKHIHFTEATISYIELLQNNTKSALYYALKSIKTMEAINDYNFADDFYLRLGNVYLALGHFEEAKATYEKSFEEGEKGSNTGGWYKSFVSLVAAMSSKGKDQEAIDYINSVTAKYPPPNLFDKMILANTKALCYDKLNNFTMAEKNYKEMDNCAQQILAPETVIDILNLYSNMTAFYAYRYRVKEATFYADKVASIAQLYKHNFSSERLESSLSKIDSINGNYLSALKHYQTYKKLNDNLVNFSKNKEIEELKIRYETQNKEKEIKLLNNQSELQKSELHKSRLLNYLAIGSSVLFLITIALLYNRYRLKQRNHAKLEQKEREIHKKNINLKHLLDEKEWLLKEIHHRVKNNLQTVISLLNSQSAYLDNDMALSAIKNSQHRIHSMSLIHQKLYNADNISTINMPNYIKELVEYLKDSFNTGQKIRFEVNIAPLELDVAQAVPIGLILNETITNSIKYAFQDDRTGMIHVTLEKVKDSYYLLTISDNGIGYNTDVSPERKNSFGMSLINGLSDDLEAKLSIDNQNGTIIKIEFLAEFLIDKNK
jgi:two-component sensor histidine kinase